MTEASRVTLRRSLRECRRALPAAARVSAAQAVAAQLLALPFAPRTGLVAGYWACDGEIALHAWQLGLPAGVRYCLPLLDGERLLFAEWQPGDAVHPNRYGIPQPGPSATRHAPETLQLVVMPLVGFDARGHRLGMGGGWYDRSFAFRHQQPAPPHLVGAAFECQRVDAIEHAAWDVSLDAVCTESESRLFPGANA
jgi:5-formyltetrahydrofolate cyclo-ligase